MNTKELINVIEEKKQVVLDAGKYIWENPEPGYREEKTHAYLKARYEELGLTVHELTRIPAAIAKKTAENGEDRIFPWIPGFWVDFETGKPGPRLAIFGELDSLIIPTHPECDPVTGAVHACGHHCQSAALLGVAIALAQPGALEGLCGSIRLIAVPAEELIETDYRKGLRDKGVIKYFGGKQELIRRGLLDDVDLAFMVHTAIGRKLVMGAGSDGCIVKEMAFLGKSAHAGGSPELGINALYAANLAMNAANALRETFVEKDCIRFHPIITAGGSAVNAIPEKVTMEAYIRGASMAAIEKTNKKINRAMAASAAAMGCRMQLTDYAGYAVRKNEKTIGDAFLAVGEELLGKERLDMACVSWSTGCSDMGDVSCIMPAAHPSIGGATGHAHGSDYFITDAELAMVTSAKVQIGAARALLENGAAQAQKVIAEYKPVYASPQAYMEAIDKLAFSGDTVFYQENGEVVLNYNA